jgi:hypothetical protein
VIKRMLRANVKGSFNPVVINNHISGIKRKYIFIQYPSAPSKSLKAAPPLGETALRVFRSG